MNNLDIGIDQISFYTVSKFISLSTIAQRDGIDAEKFHTGIGQDCFAVVGADQDCVTLAANAAKVIFDKNPDLRQDIDTIIFATESGIDQSKSAAVYVQNLLELPANCRAVEIKQACYSATAGLQMARGLCALNPNKKVLLIASDISHYDLHSPAEATQGAAAVAMVISTNPKIASIFGQSGLYTKDVMDFWRPNYRQTPLVDGKLSTILYVKAAEAAWLDYHAKDGLAFDQFIAYCYHLPFSKMGSKAHRKLCSINKMPEKEEQISKGMIYGRQIGNSYTASLYLSLCSTLDNLENLANQHIAMLSYGSGAVSEFFALKIKEGYNSSLFTDVHKNTLSNRQELSITEYEKLWHLNNEQNIRENLVIDDIDPSSYFYLQKIEDGKRIYAHK